MHHGPAAPPPPGGFGYPLPDSDKKQEPEAPPDAGRKLPLCFSGRACGPTPLILLFALGLLRVCAVGGVREATLAVPQPFAGPLEDTIDVEPEGDVLDARDLVAVDDRAVFVADARAQTITAQPKAGGDTTTLALAPGPVAWIATSGADVVFATSDEGGDGGGVYRVPKAGGEAHALARGLLFPARFAMANGDAYVTVSRLSVWDPYETDELPPTGQVLRVGKTGASTAVLAGGATDPMGIAADEREVFFADHARAQIAAAPLGGGPARVVAEHQDDARDVAVDDAAVYWTNRAAGEVMRAAKRGGGGPVAIARGHTRPTGVVVGDASVYFIDDAGPTEAMIVRVDKRGGYPPTILAGGRTSPANLALDGDRLVWSEGGVARWVSAKQTPAPGESLVVHTFREQPASD